LVKNFSSLRSAEEIRTVFSSHVTADRRPRTGSVTLDIKDAYKRNLLVNPDYKVEIRGDNVLIIGSTPQKLIELLTAKGADSTYLTLNPN
jgi:hypothetical protein